MDNGRSHIETNEGMHPFVMGCSFGAIVATILFCVLAFNLLKKKKKKRASTPSFISPTPTGEGNDHYDVFLSFRGSDTCKGFADHLYHSLDKAGIVPSFVFRDDKSIPIGEEFGPWILDAIARSKISIPIISKNYATSKWCLRELIHMMDCKNSMSHVVLPIFYKVKPSDVRYLKGSFGDAFRSSQKHLNEKDILEGQRALNQVSFLHGWESKKFANGHEGELIERVVETIIRKLQEDFLLDVPQQLVGLDGCMKEIMNWIDSPSINARMIGIYGMGGIGKTTLAKCIYNQLLNKFMHVSFLSDVRETIRQKGITYLQSQLISDILLSKRQVSRIDRGISIIKSRFRGKKVLILLDDIDDKNQLDALAKKRDWFMAGSLIIVTTRNEAVLDQSEFEVDYKYKLNELDMMQSLLLFNRHAFHMDHSRRDFKGISCDIISTMGGLPLALQVVGSYLYKKTNRDVWEDVRKQLKNQPHRDVQKMLRISYDALRDEHKQIFLDIVCFFIGKTSKYAMYMWEDCEGIEELKLRCFIKIGDHDELIVHDQLRDLGRSIFCQGQPLEKHSGPWDDNYEGVPRVLRHLERHPRLHDFLGAASSEHSKQLLSEVRWLQWNFIESDVSVANLHLPKLSVLEIFYSDITEDWEGWSSFTASKQLKVLDLNLNWHLRCTPNLSAFTQLKILMLRSCTELKHLHRSISKLRSLVSLNLNGCKRLKELPEEVRKLTNLVSLNLNGCKCLEELPNGLGKLRSLVSLDLCDCESLEMLPKEVGKLTSLVSLDLRDCGSLQMLPEEVGQLMSLVSLNLNGCRRLEELPEEVGKLTSLVSLDLRDCESLQMLPEEVGQLMSLVSLNLNGCKCLEELPEEVGKLTSLVSLDLRDCESLQMLPEEVGQLMSLVSLNLNACKRLEELPEEVGKLTSLVSLDLTSCRSLKKLPEEVGELKDLEELLLDCSGITKIPPSIASLRKLKKLSAIRCGSLREIPSSIGDLQNLQHLNLSQSKIKKLPSAIGSLRKLKNLSAACCKSLREIPISIGDLQNLQHLDLSWSAIEKLPSAIGRLKSLRTLDLSECHSLKGAIPSEIGYLSSLEKLDLSFTPISDLPESVRNLSSLQSLSLCKCFELRSLPELPLGLTDLWVTCQSLGLPQLLSLIHLKELNLVVDHLLEDIREPSSILLKLCFEWDKLTLLSLHGPGHLVELSIKKCNSIETLALSQLIHLKQLRIEHCNSLLTIKSFGNLESLEVIFLYECKCLKTLNASECGNLVEIQGLDGAKFLEVLDFTGCKSLETLPDLTGFEKLRSLRVRDCKKLTQLQGLEKLNLIDLDISG